MKKHAPGSLAAKLVKEAPTVVHGSSGRPGYVRVRWYDGNDGWRFSPEFHRDTMRTDFAMYANDPDNLLERPNSD